MPCTDVYGTFIPNQAYCLCLLTLLKLTACTRSALDLWVEIVIDRCFWNLLSFKLYCWLICLWYLSGCSAFWIEIFHGLHNPFYLFNYFMMMTFHRSKLMAGGASGGMSTNPWLVNESEETRGLTFGEIKQQQQQIIEGNKWLMRDILLVWNQRCSFVSL